MIQFNLLPDVKLQFVKANRIKHVVSFVAVTLAGIALGVMILLILTVDVFQKHHINNLNSQITTLTGQLKNTSNLNQVLTVQNEVNALPALNANKPVTTRLSGYIAELTPSAATISTLNINFQTGIVSISGSADDLATVTQYVDTLKEATYQTSSTSPSSNAFSDVVLTSFGYTSTNGATYTITADFVSAIFSGSYSSVPLNVPNSSNHSNSSQSEVLFQPQSSSSTNSSSSSGN